MAITITIQDDAEAERLRRWIASEDLGYLWPSTLAALTAVLGRPNPRCPHCYKELTSEADAYAHLKSVERYSDQEDVQDNAANTAWTLWHRR